MSADLRPVSDRTIDGAGVPEPTARGHAAAVPPLSDDTRLAVAIRNLVERGEMDEARDRFSELVTQHQRRASRIAYQYLRDAAEADEAVQDAFVKVFSHITS
jgi:ADP-ribosylglycohydrolase